MLSKFVKMHIIYILFGFFIKYVTTEVVTLLSSKPYKKPYNPTWDAKRQRLILGDYADGKLLCYIPSENTINEAAIPGITTPWFALPLKKYDNMYLTTRNHTCVVVDWDCRSSIGNIVRDTFTVETDPAYILHNWHTAKVSPQCRFYGGTLRQSLCGSSSEPNAFGYSYSKCHGVETILSDQKILGGFEWNAKGNKFYQINSCDMSVWVYDYDGKTGKISNGYIIFRYQGNYGDPISFPIQLTLDTDDNLYVSIYLGGVVLKISRTGEILKVIFIPGQVTAGITWGGENLDILYVTAFSLARDTYTGQTINKTYDGSGLYAVTELGAKGFPARQLCI